MGRYRKIDTRTWNDEKFRALSDRGKLSFLFLLSHPHMTSLGAMRATLPGLAAEIGWEAKAFTKAFGEAAGRGMVVHDPRAAFVGLPRFLRYNAPESPNVVRSWRGVVDLIPECHAKARFLQIAEQKCEALGEGFLKAFREAFGEDLPKGMPNPEPEPEPKLEPEPEPPSEGAVPLVDFEAFWSAYPRKEAKEAARKAWQKLAPAAGDWDRMRAGLERQKTSAQWTKDNGQFIPLPATWLNGKRWQDEGTRVAAADVGGRGGSDVVWSTCRECGTFHGRRRGERCMEVRPDDESGAGEHPTTYRPRTLENSGDRE